jgi:hypothetical protein
MYSSRVFIAQLTWFGAAAAPALGAPAERTDTLAVKPFVVDLSADVPRMLDLVRHTRLPDHPEYATVGSSAGIALDVLSRLQTEWTHDFDWRREEAALNKYNHFTAQIEGLTIHFIHQRSKDPDAIPLLLIHGWPGSFLEFLPVVNTLTEKSTTSTGKPVSFHIIVPSLPGFTFSSPPPANWTVDDTARVYNTLMTELLGYKTFAVFGTDFGAGPAYSLYDNFNSSTRAAHFTFLPFFPLTPDQLAAQNITLSSSLEQTEEQNFLNWETVGNGYFKEQSTKVGLRQIKTQ